MTDNMTPVELATLRQGQAADPAHSVFVSANAGSGKTKVLVDRVSRLLLGDVPAQKILCLTYTKAAATEMQARLYKALGTWSVIDDVALQDKLAQLDGNPAPRSEDALRKARQLFAQALETPEGLKVQTIHAFCERLLRRFPIEAGIAPGFDSMDDRDHARILETVKSDIAKDALANKEDDLAIAISTLAAKNGDGYLDGIYSYAAYNQDTVTQWAQQGGLKTLAARLNIDADLTPQQAMIEAWNGAPKDEILQAAHDMSRSGKTNQASAQKIYAALEASDPVMAYKLYARIFHTASFSPRAAVSTSNVADHLFSGSKKGYGYEAERMFTAIDRVNRARALRTARAIYTLARRVAVDYEAQKRARRLLDFSDQILLAERLLNDSAARNWVRYKLDQGVDHILLDEAQDTSALQWRVIDGVTAEFDTLEAAARTRFAVGDEKQSIYSFQGAKPELFRHRQQDYVSADNDMKVVTLPVSFRSAPQVLRMVDAVFKDAEAITQMFGDDPLSGDLTPEHLASREDAGRVELWPLAPPPEPGEGESAWDFENGIDAVDSPDSTGSREKLAQEIAAQIKNWLDSGEQVFDRDTGKPRPMRPGDIMILVQKRVAFFDAIIRHLKLAHIAVAGADKLQLTDNIGVQDLISLGKFIALPSDDLSLAEVLKSPIFDLNDDDLIWLTGERDKDSSTLWEALNSVSRPNLLEARGTLRKILKVAAGLAPYEMYARILSTLMWSHDGEKSESVLKRLYGRLGVEAADPIEAFLSKALAHQRSGPPSLDRFLRDLAGDGSTIKREMDPAAAQVRVMTVHGSKGLEAPVVILPDTTQMPGEKSKGFGIDLLPEGGFAPQLSAPDTPQALTPVTEARAAAIKQEYLRLLYVAMTRAESRLIVCGFHSGHRNKALKDGCWYDWVQRGFNALGEAVTTDTHGAFGEIRAYGPRSRGAAAETLKMARPDALPDWARRAAPREAPDSRRVTPSHILSEALAPATLSPLAIDSSSPSGRFGRGIIIHKLLEILPDAAPARRREIARAYLAAQSQVSPQNRDAIETEVFSVLDAPEFAAIFAPGSMAEVSLAGTASGLPRNIYMNAQIDRLSVNDDTVWIVDYKSNRPPPDSPCDIAPLYIAQMAAYRALAREIYPKRSVKCGLLWTDVPKLMEVPDALMDAYDLGAALAADKAIA